MIKLNPQDILDLIISDARAAGAEAVDALMYESVSNAVSVRLGQVEEVER